MVIVDSVDDMAPAGANALLKELEEPPKDTTLLLVSHQPSRLLPTIRSRCRELRCHDLPPAALQQAREAVQKLKSLQKRLEKAVTEENFEEAAQLRDEIKRLK